MGQHGSKPTGGAVNGEDIITRRPRSRSTSTASTYLTKLKALSWSRRTSPATPLSPARRSLIGRLFRSSRSTETHTVTLTPSSENSDSANEPPNQQAQATPEDAVASVADEHVRPTHPGTLMIMHGTMPPSEDSRVSSEQTSPTDDTNVAQETIDQAETHPQTPPPVASVVDERLQTSIDILAALLSMATAATATSLLTGTTDVLATLSSDSAGGPQVLPARARVAWDTLENLFYLRSDRQPTMSPHMELFRDLTLAILTSRLSSTSLAGSGQNRNQRPPLQSGTFERFLVDLNTNVRTSLREDYLRRGSENGPETAAPVGRLNWWRAYQFPSIDVSNTVESRFTSSNRRPGPGHEGVFESSPGRDPGIDDSSSTTTQNPRSNSTSRLVPVVLVGLRSLSRDGANNASPSSLNTSPSTGTPVSTSTEETSSQNAPPSPHASILDEVDAISSSYVIIVLGGHYPPEHRYALASGSENPSDLDQLWDLVDIVPPKPPTATADEISKSGLACFKASRIGEMKVAENTVEKCLICLDDYTEDVDLRLLSCSHAFHRDCIDRWFIEGQNGCPLCRTQGVRR